jgi:endonuclease/exonuclease/phosphatase family metal-dependent hydrolase
MTPTIRLCTWNIEFGLQLDAIVAALESCADFATLDMLALQEASIHHGVDDGRVIAGALGANYEYYQMAAQRVNGRVQANALIWNVERVQVDSKSSVKLPQRHEVKLSHAERLFLRAIPLQRRISLVVEGRVAEKLLRIYVAHLDVMGYELKRQQFHYILNDASARPLADLSIIAGDLNTFRLFRARPSWKQLEDAANSAGFRDITTEILWTRSASKRRLKQKLDAIFIRQARTVPYRSWSREIAGSDHIPVFAELQLE